MCCKVSKTSPVLAILPTSIFPSVSPIVYISIFAILLGIVPTWGSASHLRQCVTKCLNLVVCKPVTQWVDKHFSFTPRPIYCQVSLILPGMARQPPSVLSSAYTFTSTRFYRVSRPFLHYLISACDTCVNLKSSAWSRLFAFFIASVSPILWTLYLASPTVTKCLDRFLC